MGILKTIPVRLFFPIHLFWRIQIRPKTIFRIKQKQIESERGTQFLDRFLTKMTMVTFIFTGFLYFGPKNFSFDPEQWGNGEAKWETNLFRNYDSKRLIPSGLFLPQIYDKHTTKVLTSEKQVHRGNCCILASTRQLLITLILVIRGSIAIANSSRTCLYSSSFFWWLYWPDVIGFHPPAITNCCKSHFVIPFLGAFI